MNSTNHRLYFRLSVTLYCQITSVTNLYMYTVGIFFIHEYLILWLNGFSSNRKNIKSWKPNLFIIIPNICPENKSQILKSGSICDQFSVFSKENGHQTSHWLVMTGWITEKFIFKSHDHRSYFVLIFMFNFRVWTIKYQEFIQADLHFKS